jgi:hypothetical protein
MEIFWSWTQRGSTEQMLHRISYLDFWAQKISVSFGYPNIRQNSILLNFIGGI